MLEMIGKEENEARNMSRLNVDGMSSYVMERYKVTRLFKS